MSARDIPKLNPFEDDSPATLAGEIFGQPDATLDSGRVVARPTPIMGIWADVRQPRRAVPMAARGAWTGNPEFVPTMLLRWHEMAETAAGRGIDVPKLLDGDDDYVIDTAALPALARRYVEFVLFAANIRSRGLIYPIKASAWGNGMLIESGERRWLAHHLLNATVGGFDRIPVIVSDVEGAVWRQAGENTQRSDLNAIGRVRQLALLIMQARVEAGLQTYLTMDEMFQLGGSDRDFYAQVANGDKDRIPRGWGGRIRETMRLATDQQISQYRSLLALYGEDDVDDALWEAADDGDWPENALREIRRTLTAVKVREITTRRGWTLDDLRPEKPVPVTSANLMGQTRTVTPSNLPSAAAPAPRGVAPISRPPLKLRPDDMVEAHGNLGRVIEEKVVGGEHGYLLFLIDSQRNNWYADSVIRSLGMTYAEFMAGNDGATEPEPAISPTQIVSDNASSVTVSTADDGANGLIFPDGDPARVVLLTLKVLARHTGYDAARDVLYAMVSMKRTEATALGDDLGVELASWSSVMSEAFGGWYQMVEDYIQRVYEEARR